MSELELIDLFRISVYTVASERWVNAKPSAFADRRSKSARTALLDTGRTGEESAADGLGDYLGARRVETASSSRNGNAALRAEIVGFDLAAHFLHAIVVSVDFMTFQTRNMRDAAEKLAGIVDSMRLCGIVLAPAIVM
jgi:hypothetical protein